MIIHRNKRCRLIFGYNPDGWRRYTVIGKREAIMYLPTLKVFPLHKKEYIPIHRHLHKGGPSSTVTNVHIQRINATLSHLWVAEKRGHLSNLPQNIRSAN